MHEEMSGPCLCPSVPSFCIELLVCVASHRMCREGKPVRGLGAMDTIRQSL